MKQFVFIVMAMLGMPLLAQGPTDYDYPSAPLSRRTECNDSFP